VALRSMKAPGTAFDDPVLGKDPQPAYMSDYVETTSDNGGVHINSGISNHAFYLVATALGGYAWEKAGLIWYRTLLDSRLSSTSEFADFARLSADNAAKLFGAAEQRAVADAWKQVGVTVADDSSKLAGRWTLYYSWGCTDSYEQAAVTFHREGTFDGDATGQWWRQDGTVLLSFNDGPARYAGTLSGSVATGAQSTFSGLNGCWYMMRQGTGASGIPLSGFARSGGTYDAAGNPLGGSSGKE
jgi:hypothetical protein